MGAAWARFGNPWLLAAVALVVVLAAALAIGLMPSGRPIHTATPGPPIVNASPLPFQRTFGPDFPERPPSRGVVRLDGAVLSHDRMTVYVSFIGGKAYQRDSWCSVDYEPWAGIVAGELHIAINAIHHPDQATFPPDGACTAEGYTYLFELALPVAFGGVVVRDLASDELWAPIPERTAELAAIPDGWRLYSVWTSKTSEPGPRTVVRIWGPSPDDRAQGDRSIFLEQAFGEPIDFSAENPIGEITVKGQHVPVVENGPDGLMAAWVFAGDGFRLGVYDPQFTLDDFEAMANGIAIPPP